MKSKWQQESNTLTQIGPQLHETLPQLLLKTFLSLAITLYVNIQIGLALLSPIADLI